MAAATFQGEIMQGHLMACQSHSLKDQGDPARTRFRWGPWTSTGPGERDNAQGLELPTDSPSPRVPGSLSPDPQGVLLLPASDRAAAVKTAAPSLRFYVT